MRKGVDMFEEDKEIGLRMELFDIQLSDIC